MTLLRITLDRPAQGVARGQAAVLYDGDTVLGSGTISGPAPGRCPGGIRPLTPPGGSAAGLG